MTTQTKVLLGGAAVVALVLFLRSRNKGPTGKVILGEFTVARDSEGRCGCFLVENLADGTVKTTKVDRAKCNEQSNLRDELSRCDGGATDITDLDIFTRP